METINIYTKNKDLFDKAIAEIKGWLEQSKDIKNVSWIIFSYDDQIIKIISTNCAVYISHHPLFSVENFSIFGNRLSLEMMSILSGNFTRMLSDKLICTITIHMKNNYSSNSDNPILLDNLYYLKINTPDDKTKDENYEHILSGIKKVYPDVTALPETEKYLERAYQVENFVSKIPHCIKNENNVLAQELITHYTKIVPQLFALGRKGNQIYEADLKTADWDLVVNDILEFNSMLKDLPENIQLIIKSDKCDGKGAICERAIEDATETISNLMNYSSDTIFSIDRRAAFWLFKYLGFTYVYSLDEFASKCNTGMPICHFSNHAQRLYISLI